jgi:hypothetical protein
MRDWSMAFERITIAHILPVEKKQDGGSKITEVF